MARWRARAHTFPRVPGAWVAPHREDGLAGTPVLALGCVLLKGRADPSEDEMSQVMGGVQPEHPPYTETDHTVRFAPPVICGGNDCTRAIIAEEEILAHLPSPTANTMLTELLLTPGIPPDTIVVRSK